MRAADLILRMAGASGIRRCFTCPGTTEMPFVEAFDRTSEIVPVLCAFENVASGAADGHARMTGMPGLTIVHLGPGFANGIANLHNARRARSPVITLIGEHAEDHQRYDPGLAMPIAAMAASFGGHVRTIGSPEDAPRAFADSFAAATRGTISSLIFPHNIQLADAGETVDMARPSPLPAVGPHRIEQVARKIRKTRAVALYLGGKGGSEEGLHHAARISAHADIALFHETFTARIERGAGIPSPTRLPYFRENAKKALDPFDVVLLAGAPFPVTYFGFDGLDGRLVGPDREVVLAHPEEDVVTALRDLADALDAPDALPSTILPGLVLPPLPTGRLTIETMAMAFAALQPEGAIIVDEGLTSGFHYQPMANRVRPHTTLTLTGGAIGSGIPLSLGAALACPDRPVLTLQGDGSALFSVQGLWSQAREKANVKTVICSNRKYDILKIEVTRSGNTQPGRLTEGLTDLANPDLGWVEIANGFGVPALQATTAEGLVRALQTALEEPGPFLVEAVLT